jgi:hypothetical protein
LENNIPNRYEETPEHTFRRFAVLKKPVHGFPMKNNAKPSCPTEPYTPKTASCFAIPRFLFAIEINPEYHMRQVPVLTAEHPLFFTGQSRKFRLRRKSVFRKRVFLLCQNFIDQYQKY